MAHEIFGQRFLGRRVPAWHELGQVFPETERVSPPVGLLRINGDFHIQKYPLVVDLPDGRTEASDRVAIVRHPTVDDGAYHILGYAGKDYEVVQNLELAFMIERLAETWPLETIGILDRGGQIFMTLDAGMSEVGGEEVRQYFLLSNDHTGKRALRIAVTPVRVVCQNTLIMGLKQASVTSALPHTMNVKTEAEFRINLIATMRARQEGILATLNQMAVTRVVDEQVEQILLAAYPVPTPPKRKLLADLVVKDPALMSQIMEDRQVASATMNELRTITAEWEREVKRADNLRSGARERYQVLNDEHPKVAQTIWAVYNGVTETECYRNGDPKNPRGTSESILFGERAQVMSRAFEASLEVMGRG